MATTPSMDKTLIVTHVLCTEAPQIFQSHLHYYNYLVSQLEEKITQDSCGDRTQGFLLKLQVL